MSLGEGIRWTNAKSKRQQPRPAVYIPSIFDRIFFQATPSASPSNHLLTAPCLPLRKLVRPRLEHPQPGRLGGSRSRRVLLSSPHPMEQGPVESTLLFPRQSEPLEITCLGVLRVKNRTALTNIPTTNGSLRAVLQIAPRPGLMRNFSHDKRMRKGERGKGGVRKLDRNGSRDNGQRLAHHTSHHESTTVPSLIGSEGIVAPSVRVEVVATISLATNGVAVRDAYCVFFQGSLRQFLRTFTSRHRNFYDVT